MTDGDGEGTESRRLDRWLWFARVVKSRTLAASLVTDGRVRLNKEKVTKPAQAVKPGDVLTIVIGPRLRILKVLDVGERRGPAPEARTLYEDLSPAPPPPGPRSPADGAREPGSGRPTKRDRRDIERWKDEHG